MKLEVLKSESDFHLLRDSWKRLTSEPLRSWEWHFNWWQQFGDDFELKLVVATVDEQVVAVAPLMVELRLGEKCLRFIGSGNTCTDYAQYIVASEYESKFAIQFASLLDNTGGPLAQISLVELEGVTEKSNSQSLIENVGDQFWSYQKSLESTWIIDLPNSWVEFKSSRCHSLRRKLKKAEKRFSQKEAVVRSTRDGYEFDAAFEILVNLHQRRFHSKGEPGVFADSRFKTFLYNATKQLVADGHAEIVVCEVNGKPIVAHHYLVGADGLQLYQSGVCPESMQYEPGHLLFTHVVRDAINRNHARFDFLRGDEPYKKFWGAERCELFRIRMVSKRIPSTVKHQLIRGLRHVRTAIYENKFFATENGVASS